MAQASRMHSVRFRDSNVNGGNLAAVSTTHSKCPTRIHGFYVGSRHQSQVKDTRACVPTGLAVSGNGFLKRGSGGVAPTQPRRLSCFAPGVREWARYT